MGTVIGTQRSSGEKIESDDRWLGVLEIGVV
jgi:hypothetical protein